MTGNAADRMVGTFASASVERIYETAGDRLSGFKDGLHRRTDVDLSALLEALVRLASATPETTLLGGPLELDLLERTASRRGRSIDLLPREFRLLEYMMRHKGKVLTREMLFKEVWKYKFDPKTNLVDVHMGRLRRKVDEPDEQPLILNVRGKGFVLRTEELDH
jgi:two-component system OmpR family response regulator